MPLVAGFESTPGPNLLRNKRSRETEKRAHYAFIGDEQSNFALPIEISSSSQFERSLLKVRNQHSEFEKIDLFESAYYLLGMLTGDAHRQFSKNHPFEARAQLDLCRGHQENLVLGEFFSDCINKLGVSCARISDLEPVPREPHGLYRWVSRFSPMIGWLHVACLGLGRDQKTTVHPVKMEWLLSAQPGYQLWYLRGLADSDGTVSVRNKEVILLTAPNSEFIQRLLESLQIHSSCGHTKGISYVAISARVAMDVHIFNPRVETHRAKLLRVLVSARTYQRRWPRWLEEEVNSLLHQGLEVSDIRDKLLFEHGVYVKLRTLKVKRHVNETRRHEE